MEVKIFEITDFHKKRAEKIVDILSDLKNPMEALAIIKFVDSCLTELIKDMGINVTDSFKLNRDEFNKIKDDKCLI